MKGSDLSKDSHFLTVWRIADKIAYKIKILREMHVGPIKHHLVNIFPKEKQG